MELVEYWWCLSSLLLGVILVNFDPIVWRNVGESQPVRSVICWWLHSSKILLALNSCDQQNIGWLEPCDHKNSVYFQPCILKNIGYFQPCDQQNDCAFQPCILQNVRAFNNVTYKIFVILNHMTYKIFEILQPLWPVKYWLPSTCAKQNIRVFQLRDHQNIDDQHRISTRIWLIFDPRLQ